MAQHLQTSLVLELQPLNSVPEENRSHRAIIQYVVGLQTMLTILPSGAQRSLRRT